MVFVPLNLFKIRLFSLLTFSLTALIFCVQLESILLISVPFYLFNNANILQKPTNNSKIIFVIRASIINGESFPLFLVRNHTVDSPWNIQLS